MRLSLKLAIALVILTLSTLAFAGNVTMQFNSVGGNSYQGVAAYPYYGTVNGHPESIMCISFNEHVGYGETWTADAMSVDAYGAFIGNVQKADQLAFLFTIARDDNSQAADANGAAWELNEPGSLALSGNALFLYDFAQSLTYHPGEFSSVEVFVPTDVATQTFMGSTPEPSTLLMMGSGLIGLAGLARKRLFN